MYDDKYDNRSEYIFTGRDLLKQIINQLFLEQLILIDKEDRLMKHVRA